MCKELGREQENFLEENCTLSYFLIILIALLCTYCSLKWFPLKDHNQDGELKFS